MPRRQKDPLRPLSDAERLSPSRLSRSQSAPAAQVARARAVLAVADGQSYATAAELVGRATGDTVARWVAAFNRDGLVAVEPRHGGGHSGRYGEAEQRRILAEAGRGPERARDGTAAWSLTTLRDALRRADDGLPGVTTYPIGPASAPTRSAARCMRPGTAGRGGGAGARPAWSCAGASTKARSPSPIRTPRQKGADRASLHARRRPRPGGLVGGRGRPVPGRAAAGRQLATARPPGDPAARVRPGWHLQGPDPVPSRDGTGAPPAGQQLHQPDPAWLAQGAARGDPGGAAGTRCAARCGSAPRRVGGLAGRPGGALHLARRAAAPAHAPGVGQPGRPQDGRDGGLAVPARHHAALHPARRQLAEHGRVHPAHPEAAHARRPASAEPGRDRRLVPADRRGLEPATHALPVERQAPAEATEATR